MDKKEIIYKSYIQREMDFLRPSYDPEIRFYNAVKLGDCELVKELCHDSFSKKESGWGILSKDHIQSLKYHFAISIALVARYCIEGGLELSKAYDMSDYYIEKCDRCKRVNELSSLHEEACLTYATTMNELRKNKIHSKLVTMSIDYISANLHKKITPSDVANKMRVSEAHLSREFKKSTNTTIVKYIQDMKLNTAKNMLEYSDFTILEIANIFAFSDQSYFTETFRKKFGISPGKYKRQINNREND